jgi:hypothetical protein
LPVHRRFGTVTKAGNTPVETLSTGHRVRLPLAVTFDAFGGAFLARAGRLRERLPAACVPVQIAPGVGTIVLAGVDYRDVGGFDPYGEFAVIVPCVRGGQDVPLLGALTGEIGGHVDFLPVTTEASVALGREIWGYPKVLADVRFDRRGGEWTVTLEREGQLICRLDGPSARPRGRTTTAYSYTTTEDRLLRTRIDIDGPFGLRPFDPRVRVECGPDEYGRMLEDLLLGRQSVASLVGRRVGARLYAGESV